MKTKLIFLPALLGLLTAAVFTSPLIAAENATPPAHEIFIGILDKAPTGEYRLQV
jgi:hypothetical protein